MKNILLICVLFATTAFAHPPQEFTDHLGLYIEQAMGLTEKVCTSRQPKTKGQWAKAIAIWRSTFSGELSKLDAATQLLEKNAEQKAISKTSEESFSTRYSRLWMIQQMKTSASVYAVENFAGANDAEAAKLCLTHLHRISDLKNGKDEIAKAMEGAGRLLQAEKLPLD